jgi:hypothetical protein
MKEHPTTSSNVAELARLVNCLDEDSVATLAGVKPSTLDAWRKRGKGPEYILLGRNYLYPIAAIQKYVSGLVRTRTSFDPQLGLM